MSKHRVEPADDSERVSKKQKTESEPQPEPEPQVPVYYVAVKIAKTPYKAAPASYRLKLPGMRCSRYLIV